jgi:hypothetical protein
VRKKIGHPRGDGRETFLIWKRLLGPDSTGSVTLAMSYFYHQSRSLFWCF